MKGLLYDRENKLLPSSVSVDQALLSIVHVYPTPILKG